MIRDYWDLDGHPDADTADIEVTPAVPDAGCAGGRAAPVLIERVMAWMTIPTQLR